MVNRRVVHPAAVFNRRKQRCVSGSMDALYANLNYIRRSRQEYVLLCNSLIVFNADFRGMVKSYEQSGADVCMMYSKNRTCSARNTVHTWG